MPDTVYGQTKLEAEGRLKDILPELWIVRFTWLFGLPQRGCGMSGEILWGTLQSVLRGQCLKVSKNEFRGMTYVHEMVENIVKLFELPYGTYHLGAENAKSRYEIVREILEGIGISDRLPELLAEDTVKYAAKARDIRLDTTKAREAGLVFSDTSTAVRKCLKEYKLGC